MISQLSDRVLRFLAEPGYRPVKPKRLAHAMGIGEDEYQEFKQTLRALLEGGKIAVGGGGTLVRPNMAGQLIGIYRANRRGFGFVIPEDQTAHGDLFVPPGASLDAQSGDTVLVRVKKAGFRAGKPSFNGEVLQILTRGQTKFVGRLHHQGNRWLVQPEGDKLHEPIHVEDVGAKGAKSGDHVVVEIIEYPSPGKHGTGVIVERLGAHGHPGVDVLSIIRQHDIPDEYSEAALEDARQAARAFDVEAELDHREDLRETLTITIDPVDARDFDDAISLRRVGENGAVEEEAAVVRRANSGASGSRKGTRESRRGGGARARAAMWELGVHIADVSHFVPQDSALDLEARERGTSVYFPRHVIPMLPEIISNGVCSLQEGKPRLCKSAFIQYDDQGRVVGARMANTVIQSAKRLTYEQASAALDGHGDDLPHSVLTLLRDMEQLARVIRERRLQAGMLVLDLPDVDLVLDERGRVVDAHPTDQSFSHTIIEMFMVEANEAAARYLTEKHEPFLRRVHPPPDPQAIEAVSKFLRGVGLHVPPQADRKDLQRLLDEVRGRTTAPTVNLTVLRSMAQAVYSPAEEGHYALASENYCHFTSPIRRYPDLHVHRLLQAFLGGERRSDEAIRDGAQAARRRESRKAEKLKSQRARHAQGTRDDSGMDVAGLGKHCSFVERRAEQAERELKLVKVLELLSREPGEAFEGLVTGVAGFGVFVQHPRFLVEGLIEVLDLPDDRWELDDTRSVLVGYRTGRRFRIGDRLNVAIARVDLPTRRLSLSLVEKAGTRPVATRREREAAGADGEPKRFRAHRKGAARKKSGRRRGR